MLSARIKGPFLGALLICILMGLAFADEFSHNCAAFLRPLEINSYQVAYDLDAGREAYGFLLREFAFHMDLPKHYAYYLAKDASTSHVLKRWGQKIALLRYLRSAQGLVLRANISRKTDKRILHHFRDFYHAYLPELAQRLRPQGNFIWRYHDFAWQGQRYPAITATFTQDSKVVVETANSPLRREFSPGLAVLASFAQRIQEAWAKAGRPGEATWAVTDLGKWNSGQGKSVWDMAPPEEEVIVQDGYFFLPWFVFDDAPRAYLALEGSLAQYLVADERLTLLSSDTSFNFAAIDAKIAMLNLLKTAPTEIFPEEFRKAQRQAALYFIRHHVVRGQKLLSKALETLQNAADGKSLALLKINYHPYTPAELDARHPFRQGGYVTFSFEGPKLAPLRAKSELAAYTVRLPVKITPEVSSAAAQSFWRDYALQALREEQQHLWGLGQRW